MKAHRKTAANFRRDSGPVKRGINISICIPVYNGAKTIEPLVHEIISHLKQFTLEIVLVNDGSDDDSEAVCEHLARTIRRVTFISLRRNFGEHNAVMCALNHATGDYAVIVDDDFQNPPSEIIKLIETALEGFDVVYARYREKKHSRIRNIGSRFNDIIATWLLDKPRNLYLSSFKIINRAMIDEVIRYRGPFPYLDGLLLRATSHIGVVEVEHQERIVGKSTYTLVRLLSLWLNMFINFSIKPLRIFTFAGVVISIVSFIILSVFIIEKLLYPETIIGWTSIAVAIFFFAGIQLIFLGLISEYVGKQYLDLNRTPQYTVKKIVR